MAMPVDTWCYIDSVIDGISRGHLAAQKNWATALQTYRTAVLAYRRLLEMRAARTAARVPIAAPVLPLRRSRPITDTSRLDGLTPREREVADLLARGYSNQQIAETLVLVRGTVANHVAHILAKLGAANRTQVAAWVLDRGSVDTRGAAASGPASGSVMHMPGSGHRGSRDRSASLAD
jgi:DNA-binding NarL/FixJ family response regulator